MGELFPNPLHTFTIFSHSTTLSQNRICTTNQQVIKQIILWHANCSLNIRENKRDKLLTCKNLQL